MAINDVKLLDQFDVPELFDIRRAKRFCNPYYPITDDRQLLTFYSTFPQEGPIRVAEVRNQFGNQKLILRAPAALAVPTTKIAPNQHEPPVGLDHFRCYSAWGNPVNKPVALFDKFIDAWTPHYVLNPVAFCNPTEKTLPNGETTQIVNPEAHLTCYSMTRAKFEGEASIRNQFAGQRFRLGSPDTLCVPTEKVDWYAIED